jgi:hypothetical protein
MLPPEKVAESDRRIGFRVSAALTGSAKAQRAWIDEVFESTDLAVREF